MYVLIADMPTGVKEDKIDYYIEKDEHYIPDPPLML